jgi:cathepsin D
MSEGLIDGEPAGIVVLTFRGIANTHALPFWQAVINQSLLTNPDFSFFPARFVNDPNTKTEEPGGMFTLGGTNP